MEDTLLIGATAGGIGRTIVAPIDRIKIIYQSNIFKPFTWKGAFLTFHEIKQKEGIKGLWRGNMPSLVRVLPYEAIKFKVYLQFNSNQYSKLFAGMIAGICGEVCTYPIETIRTKISYRIGQNNTYLRIIKELGISGMYRGINPAILSSASYNGISFGMYEYWKEYNYTVAAILAGISSTLCCYPMEIVKRRRQVGIQADPIEILKKEGISAFYKGITFNCTKSAFLMIIVFQILRLDKHFK